MSLKSTVVGIGMLSLYMEYNVRTSALNVSIYKADLFEFSSKYQSGVYFVTHGVKRSYTQHQHIRRADKCFSCSEYI